MLHNYTTEKYEHKAMHCAGCEPMIPVRFLEIILFFNFITPPFFITQFGVHTKNMNNSEDT